MSRLIERVFWQTVAETTVGYAGAAAVSVLTLPHVSPRALLVGVGAGAALGFSKSLSSLKIQPDNGTDSFNPNVVAADKTQP